MTLEAAPVARTTMLIRRPAAEVFEAFADPSITRHFWFSRGTARLHADARITWYWDMYGVSADVQVTAYEPAAYLRIEWPTPVEWRFEAQDAESTLVTITASHFEGTDDECVAQALDAVGGFSLVLAGAKAWLEHGIALQLIADQNPAARVDRGE